MQSKLVKHLGGVVSSDLSWSNYITSICAKAKRILGLLYRKYYNHVEGDVLNELYISLIRPYLEYGCAAWDPYTLKDKRNLEQVQKFACKMVSSTGMLDVRIYWSWWVYLRLNTIYLKLCLLYKITHGLCHFPIGIFTPRYKFLTTSE